MLHAGAILRAKRNKTKQSKAKQKQPRVPVGYLPLLSNNPIPSTTDYSNPIIMYKKKATSISLPQSKTQKIMTSAVGVESVNADIVALATKATEFFLMDFARRAYDQSSDEEFRSNVLEYDDIQSLVSSDPRYEFLTDTTPKRIKFSEALKLVEEANEKKQELDQILQEKINLKKQQKLQKAAAKKDNEKEVNTAVVTPKLEEEECKSKLDNSTRDLSHRHEEDVDEEKELIVNNHQESQDEENESEHDGE